MLIIKRAWQQQRLCVIDTEAGGKVVEIVINRQRRRGKIQLP